MRADISVVVVVVDILPKRSAPLTTPPSDSTTKANAAHRSNAPTGHRLRRFWFRSLVGLVAPLLIAAYYIIVWRTYLAPLDPASPFVVGPPGATYVYYSWFVVGVVGLNLSLYGMAGVEAGMLMEPAWDAGDAMSLMMHADATWSGPGGWVKTIKRLVRLRRAGGAARSPSKLWFILALPSIFLFTAWPLSGLAFETTAGFVRAGGGVGANPSVTGFTYANFNERNIQDAIEGALVTWQYALSGRIPGKGIIYTPPSADRMPDTHLPMDDGVSRIFLTAQGDNPIHGKAWGLALEYNCSIVEKLSDFTVLKYQKSTNATKTTRTKLSYQDASITYSPFIANTSYHFNMYNVVEFGASIWPNTSAAARLLKEDPNSQSTKTSDCYFNQAENITGDYPGLDDEPTVFEMVMWQMLQEMQSFVPRPVYNLSLERNLTELNGVYDYKQFSGLNLSQPMAAIGARCVSSSSVGTADIDGVRSTFSNFARTDTPINRQTNRCAQRFGASAIRFMFGQATAPSLGGSGSGAFDGDNGKGWVSQFFRSVAAPPPFYAGYEADESNPGEVGTGGIVQLSYLQAHQLRTSLLRAHASYAVQLVFNGGQGFTVFDDSLAQAPNPNVTEFLPGTVLTWGVVPAYVPATLFVAWAVVVPFLCALYGFRRRWAPTLDGYSLFRFGADLPAAARERIAHYTNTAEVEECRALHGLPGFVGDQRSESWIGHISLVEGVRALKSKRYD